MQQPQNSQMPLSQLSPNVVSVGCTTAAGERKKARSQKRQRGQANIHEASEAPPEPYRPLQPRCEHASQPLLPWNDSEITPLRLFELFWDDYTIGILVEGTNKYAAMKEKERERLDYGKLVWRRWKKVTSDEVRVFLGLLLYLGTRREVGVWCYWREERRGSSLV